MRFIYFIIYLIVGIVTVLVLQDFKKKDIQLYKNEYYSQNIDKAHIYLNALIKNKQNSTKTMALSLANNNIILESLKTKKPKKDFLYKLSLKLQKDTDYKNIWFSIITKDGIVLDSSWSREKTKKTRVLMA